MGHAGVRVPGNLLVPQPESLAVALRLIARLGSLLHFNGELNTFLLLP